MFSSDHHEFCRRHGCALSISLAFSFHLFHKTVSFLWFPYWCAVRIQLLKLRHVHSCSRAELYLTPVLLSNYFYKTQRNLLMSLQGNQRATFHLHIPVVHLLVVVLRNLQAPAEITRTLIIMTLRFSATLYYSLAHTWYLRFIETH